MEMRIMRRLPSMLILITAVSFPGFVTARAFADVITEGFTFAVASSSSDRTSGTHFHSSTGGEFGNPAGKAEVGDFGTEEVRGLSEYDLAGLAAGPAFVTFEVFQAGGLFAGTNDFPFDGEIEIVAYEGSNTEDIADYHTATFGTVGSFFTAGLVVGNTISFDVTTLYNAAIAGGFSSLGIRLQLAAGVDAGGGAWTFENFRLTSSNESTATGTPTPTTGDPATPTPTLTPAPAAALNHFQCYETHPRPPARRANGIALVDAFGSSTGALRAPKRICNPADKNGEDPTAPGDPEHLVGYRLEQSPRFTEVADQVVTNQFGAVVVDLVRPDYLLVPSAKSLIAPPAPLGGATIDHFKCYHVRGRFRRAGITIADQFGSLTVDIKRPTRLCVPVSSDGAPIIDAAAHLLCFETRPASRVAAAGRIFVNNEFGDEELRAYRPTELCVPSELNATTGGATATPTAFLTPTPVSTATAVATPTEVPTGTPTDVATPDVTATPTPTPSSSPSPVLTELQVTKIGPDAVFTDQQFDFTITVKNIGTDSATNVTVVDDLPTDGAFVSSDPAGTLVGSQLTVTLGTIAPGDSVVITVSWRAPGGAATLVNQAQASADNAPPASDGHTVEVGIQTVVTGGVTAAGTGLRNRDNGDITIAGVPSGAVVTRAVLTWAVLYTSPVPNNQITFAGQLVTADLTQIVSSNVCWGEANTIGFAADVTALVAGNGVYAVTNPVAAVIREDADPSPAFPLTDGASLFVFYGGAGFDDQVVSDFTYSAESGGVNLRTLTGITSTGGAATLYLGGPDGQNNGSEQVRVTGSATLAFDDSWDGSDPQEGPDFSIGNLWDTDVHDISSIVPIGQTTIEIALGLGPDCTGISGVALQVEQ
jgi:uncharacterized repeat protein (TIGR01451 family)